MTTAETIQPALTAEEWEEATRFARCIPEQLLCDNEMVEQLRPLLDGALAPRMRAGAALLLWEQPFGFTHADVALLRRSIATEPYAGGSWTTDSEGTRALEALANRLAALLPPE